MILSAGKRIFGEDACELLDVTFQEAMIFDGDEQKTVQLIFTPEDAGRLSFKIFSLQDEEAQSKDLWVVHASGTLRVVDENMTLGDIPIRSFEESRQICREKSSFPESHYQNIAELGLEIGRSFQWIGPTWKNKNEAISQMNTSVAGIRADDYQFHPGLLDSCFQLIGATISEDLDTEDNIFVPVGFSRLLFIEPPASDMWCHAINKSELSIDSGGLKADLHLFDANGKIIAILEGLFLKRAPKEAIISQKHDPLSDWLYEIEWQSKGLLMSDTATKKAQSSQTTDWLIFADKMGVAERLAKLMEERGETCTMIFPRESSFPKDVPSRYTVDPKSPEDFERLFNEMGAAHVAGYRGVLHFWGLDTPVTDQVLLSSVDCDQFISCASLLHLVQALSKAEKPALQHLWIATQGAQVAGTAPDMPALAQAPIWGLGRVLALEHPELRSVLVDLDSSDVGGSLKLLMDEMAGNDCEEQVSYRKGQRYVARLVRPRLSLKDSGNRLPLPQAESYRLVVDQKGELGNLRFEPARRTSPGPGKWKSRSALPDSILGMSSMRWGCIRGCWPVRRGMCRTDYRRRYRSQGIFSW